ncbi:MAG: type II secretion system F family protein [Lentisphaeraceae bacterium]|nr:type II secretion system F family protein [Lentisphaeraceae bacterium]
MAKFQYTAMDSRGKETKGVLEADSEQDATAQLKDKGLYPTNISESGAKKKKKKKKSAGSMQITLGTPKIRKKALTTFTRQLAVLLDAGLPLVRSLRTLEKQAKKDIALQSIVGDVANSVEAGATFSESLANHKKSFNDLYVNMVKAGEASGAMEQVLNRLAEFMEKAQKLIAKVKGAMMYPAAVLGIAGIITWGLMVFIIPKFKKIFADLLDGEPLPDLTEFVIAISDFVSNNALITIGGGIVVVVLFIMFKKSKVGSKIIDTLMLKAPPFGGLFTKVAVARFCRTLSTLLASGVSILNALDIVRDTSSNQVLANAVQSVHDAVKEGETMTAPLQQANIFPDMVISMIEVGEETGALPEMLTRIADVYEDEVDVAVDGLTSLIEPMMIVMLAGIVGTIVIAMFMPMISLINKLGG